MGSYPVGSITKNGMTVEIKVNDNGEWGAEFGGKYLRGDTREKLAGAIERATKRLAKKIEIAFTEVSVRQATGDIRTRNGAVTGLHSGNGNLLITWSDGTKEQMSREYGTEKLKPLTMDEIRKLGELTKAVAQAKAAREAFVEAHEIKLRIEAEKALETRE